MAYRAFVSSTFEDLAPHRRGVIDVLRRAGFVVDPMEDWASDARAPKEFSQHRVEQCDLMILMVGHRLGFVPDGEHRSITQLEYDCARGAGMDVLTFLRDPHPDWERDETLDAAVRAWRDELAKAHGVSYFDDRPESVELGPALVRWLQQDVAQRVPHQIRAVPEDFGGRSEQLGPAVEAVRSAATRVVTINGLGGAGKTVLACAIAGELIGKFRGGQIFIDLHGTAKEPLPVSAAMQHVVRSLQPDVGDLDDPAELSGLYSSLLAEREVVLLLDDAAGRPQVAELLPPGKSIAIVTSRQRFALPGAVRIELGGLSQSDGEQFLRRICPEVAGHESTIVRLCDGLPLALRIAGDTITTRPDLAPEGFVRRLANEQKRLAQLEMEGDVASVPASLSLSYELLTTNQRTSLRQLSVFAGLFDRASLEAIWNVDEDDAIDLVGALMRHSLVEWQEADGVAGYRLHDLVRLFARGQLANDETEPLQRRHADRYARVLFDAAEENRGGGDGLARFDFARANIEAALNSVVKLSVAAAPEALRLAEALANTDGLVNRRLTRDERIAWLRLGVQAAELADATQCQCRLIGSIGSCLANEGKYQQALEQLELSSQLAHQHHHLEEIGRAENRKGQLHWRSGEPTEALACFTEGLKIAEQTQNLVEQCDLLINLALVQRELRNYDQGRVLAEEALHLSAQVGDKNAESQACTIIAAHHLSTGALASALEFAERSLELAQACGNRHQTGVALVLLGNAHRELGALEVAMDCLTSGREIMVELEDHFFAADASWHIGQTLERTGDYAAAALEMDKRRIYRESVGLAPSETDAQRVADLQSKAQSNTKGSRSLR